MSIGDLEKEQSQPTPTNISAEISQLTAVQAQLRKTEEDLTARLRQQQTVADLGQDALAGMDLPILFDKACGLVARTLNVDYCKVLELLPEGDALLLRAGIGWKEGLVGHAVVEGNKSQAGYTLLSKKPVIVADFRDENRFSAPSLLLDHKVVSGVSVIIRGRNLPFGVFGAHTRTPRIFTDEDIHFMESVANVLSTAIERKANERILDESEARTRRALEFNQAIMANMSEGLYTLDGLGLLTYINPAAERLFGWASAELIGRKMHDMIHYKHPDGTFFPADECAGLQTLKEGKVLTNHEDVFIRKDGTFFDVVYSSSPIHWEGKIAGLTVVFRDVTNQKRAENEIQRGARWLRGLIETTQDAVISIDRRACVVLFNPSAERIFGYSVDEIVGRKVNELMAEPYSSEHDGYIARYETTGEPRAIGRIRTVTAKRKNGETFPIELSVARIEADKDVQYAAFIRDVSEKVRLQEQIVENQRLVTIGTTAAKIGHELANPLNGMSLTVQLLEQRLQKQPELVNPQVTTTLNRLKTEITRLGILLEQFRSLSRREKFDFRPTSLTALVGESIELELPRIAKRGIDLECSFESNIPAVIVDIDKMKQVILNLTKNAAEAMSNGGKLSIKGSVVGDKVVLIISDTGIGIPSGVNVFEPFFTTKAQGTGIGLSVVQQIINAHGGSITYSSEHGKGTNFIIELPRK